MNTEELIKGKFYVGVFQGTMKLEWIFRFYEVVGDELWDLGGYCKEQIGVCPVMGKFFPPDKYPLVHTENIVELREATDSEIETWTKERT